MLGELIGKRNLGIHEYIVPTDIAERFIVIYSEDF